MEAKKFYTLEEIAVSYTHLDVYKRQKKSRINTSEKKVLPNVMPTKKNLTLF